MISRPSRCAFRMMAICPPWMMKDEILLTPQVKLVKKGSLPVSEGKAVRVHDLRHNKD